jgi:hypothetical protein
MAEVEAEVALPHRQAQRLAQAGSAVGPPYRVKALLDSGSAFTRIDPAVVRALGLVPFDRVTIFTPHSGPNPPPSNRHRVDLTVLHPSGNQVNNLVRSRLAVVEADIDPVGYQVVLGTDVLSRLRFVYDGGHTPPSVMLSY